MSCTAQKLLAVDIYRRVAKLSIALSIGAGWVDGASGGVENLVFDLAAATGQLRTSYLVGVEYGVFPGCVLHFWRFWSFLGYFRAHFRSNWGCFSGGNGRDLADVRAPIFRNGGERP